jgi:hypothetical protein
MEGFIIALFVCLVLALISKYLSIPAIPFYIIAGVILGKTGLGIVHSDEISRFFSDMGLLFLLFFMGLELKLDRRSYRPHRGYGDRGYRRLPAGIYPHGSIHRGSGILYHQHGHRHYIAH